MLAPKVCPMCGEADKWEKIVPVGRNFNKDKSNESKLFNLADEMFGEYFNKPKVEYYCENCGFKYYYDIF